jgi:glutathione S-transferase
VQRGILEFSGAPFKITNIPNDDRSLVWKLSKHRYYQVPIIKHGRTVVFEINEDSQVVAKYLDTKLRLGLFPPEWAGVQGVIWRYIEHEIEDVGFRLNDIYWEQNVPKAERMGFLRHKERKFGHGCLRQWREQQDFLLAQLTRRLLPCEQMLLRGKYLLGDRPLFVDFDLYGILGNFLYSGHYRLPEVHNRLADWHKRMSTVTVASFPRPGGATSG